ncbi:hypothetical protein RFI_17697 [Reticulomyxa filosa]|uniref:RGS domain-containing protein n=1 Tax=Reticulomyxa filosa TaxID=46433 RepID=X6N0E5_RETFI|nr:hypothetical protein RFI_17697 [Reticulomyxa filosa]|eukprot:ETO19531.1 hypothetical protein RFI_17697 [Reticulomyxa filosa]
MQDIRHYHKAEQEDVLRQSLSFVKDTPEKVKPDLSLIQVINNDRGYDLLMKHLATEFKFLHYQEYLYSEYFSMLENFDPKEHMIKYRLGPEVINIPGQVPKSYIVYYSSYSPEIFTRMNPGGDSLFSRASTEASKKKSHSTFNQPSNFGVACTPAIEKDINKSYDKTSLTEGLLSDSQELKKPESLPKGESQSAESIKSKSTSLMLRCRWVAYQLYEKYIAKNSSYELNVRGETRKKLELWMADRKKWFGGIADNDDINKLTFYDYFNLFDPVCKDVFQLLQDSFIRFQKTLPFDALLQNIQDLSFQSLSQERP